MQLVFTTDEAKLGSLIQLENSVILKQVKGLTNLSAHLFLPTNSTELVRINQSNIYGFSPGKIVVYDHKFFLREVLEHAIIDAYSVQTFGSLANCVIYSQEGEQVNQHIYRSGVEVKILHNPFGRLLNANYRIGFRKGVFVAPSYFWLADLLAEKTYWDYQLPDGFQVTTPFPFTIWQNQLFFEAVDNRNHLANDILFISLDLQTGQEIIKLPLETLYHQFDPQTGKLYGLIGVYTYYTKEKRLEIIDLLAGSVHIEDVHSDEPLYSINPINSVLCGHHLYFVDRRYGTEEQLYYHPRFGCLDLTNNNVTYVYEPSEAQGEQFDKPVVNGNKIYLRTASERLFVYELP